jgi:hypothetical protein
MSADLISRAHGFNLGARRMDDDAVVTYQELNTEFGITISRTDVKRKEDAGKFPKRIKPFGAPKSRFYYWRREIVAWLKGTWSPHSTPAPK